MTPIASAHRGDSSVHRENTMPAVRSAIEKGAGYVEIDVRLTADGDVVVLHDPTLTRLWGDERAIADTPTADLLAFGGLEERPPLLADVLPLFIGVSSLLVIDMDDVAFAAPSHRVVAEVLGGTGVAVDWCGDITAMRLLREIDADARVWLPWRELRPPTDDELAAIRPVTVNAPYHAMTAEIAAAVHNAGSSVTVWTVDDPEVMRAVIAMGADTITSNRLDLLHEVLAEAQLAQAPLAEPQIAEPHLAEPHLQLNQEAAR
ncbi:glycerophosphodiester phosphodiesterase [Plantibacter sp. Mn2098]|uniref:glycerophosphodiester phosphodiesterase n=1 Tax=Plantibacter sp. Mn2098 TaxID=3395266 RepID=UPI003BDC1949